MSTVQHLGVTGSGFSAYAPQPTGLTHDQQARFFALSSELFAIVDADNRFVAVNNAWEAALGWTADELNGLYTHTLMHPDDLQAARIVGDSADFHTGRTVRFVNRVRAKTGDWHWLEWNADHCLDDGFTYATARDITSRREMEQLLQATEERHRLMAQVLDESGEAIVSLDLDGVITSANRRACELYGYAYDEMIGMNARVFRSEDLQSVDDEIMATVRSKSHWRGEVQNVRRDGERFWAAVTLSGLMGPTGAMEGVTLVAVDITHRKETERELAAASANFRQIVEHSPIGIALVDLNGRWLQVNHSICEMLGYTESEMLAMEISDVVHPEDNELVRGDRVSNLPIDLGGMSEKRLIRKDGSMIWAMAVGSMVHDGEGSPHHYVCQMVDISARKRVETRLRIEADMDPLTETLNRRRFSEVLTAAITDAAPDGQLSLLFIDLDNFKGVNDTFGHPVGDELLKAVAKVLRDNVRSTDAVGRHGGDEFVVLLAGAADQVARSLAAKLAEVIAGIGIPAGGQMVRTRASIGVAHIDARTATTAEDALNLADRAMYAVKMRLPRRKANRF